MRFTGHAWRTGLAIWAALAIAPKALPQEDLNSLSPSSREQWKLFEKETFNPLFLGAAAFNASVSQITLSDPKYGGGAGPYAQRFGAAVADIGTQNFLGDYVMASILHEDTRYVRKGRQYGFWSRFGHAAASGLVTKTFSGESTVNWSNIAGTAISVGISSSYYPPASRNGGAMAINFGSSVVEAGLGNLAPEFWPDFHRWLSRHHLALSSGE